MTEPYLFRWFETGVEAIAPVKLDAEPVLGQCVWIAGTRYKILAIDRTERPPVIVIDKPEKGYREPVNAVGTLSTSSPVK